MMKLLIFLSRFVFQYNGWFLLALLLSLFTISSSIGLMMTSGYLISKAALQPSIAALHVGIVGVRFFGISRGVFRYLERLVTHALTFRILKDIRLWLYENIQTLAPSKLGKYPSGDLYSRLNDDVEVLQNFYIRLLAPPFVALIIIGLLFFVLSFWSTTFAIFIFTMLVLAGLVFPVFNGILVYHYSAQINVERTRLNLLLSESFQGLSELLVYDKINSYFTKIDKVSQNISHLKDQLNRFDSLINNLLGFVLFLTVAGSLFILLPFVEQGELDGLFLAMLVMAVMAAFEVIEPLPSIAHHLKSNLESAQRVFEIKKKEPLPSIALEATEPQSSALRPTVQTLSLRNLHFTYPEASQAVLKNINLEVDLPQKIGILGANGSGKSTLANLLSGMEPPSQGSIMINGHIQALKTLGETVNYIPQKHYIFNSSIYQNIKLGNPDCSEQEIDQVVQALMLDNWLAKLPEGIHTSVGSLGSAISGGQAQKIGIARALLCSDRPIWIFDEHASQLDYRSAADIWHNIQAYLHEKIVFVITHRLHHLEDMDRLVIMQSGEIVADSSYQAMLADPESYINRYSKFNTALRHN